MREIFCYPVALFLLGIIVVFAVIIILPQKIKDLFYLIGSCTKAGTR